MKILRYIQLFFVIFLFACPPYVVENLSIKNVFFSYSDGSPNRILKYNEPLEISAEYNLTTDEKVGFSWYVDDQLMDADERVFTFSRAPLKDIQTYKVKVVIYQVTNVNNYKEHEIRIQVLGKNAPEIYIVNRATQEQIFNKLLLTENESIELLAKAKNREGAYEIDDWKIQWRLDDQLKEDNNLSYRFTPTKEHHYLRMIAIHPTAGYSTPLNTEIFVKKEGSTPEIIISNLPEFSEIGKYSQITVQTTVAPIIDGLSYQWFVDGIRQTDENSSSFNFYREVDISSEFTINVKLRLNDQTISEDSISVLIVDKSINVGGNFNIEYLTENGTINYKTRLNNENLYFVYINRENIVTPSGSLNFSNPNMSIGAPPSVTKFNERPDYSAPVETIRSSRGIGDPNKFYDYEDNEIQATLRFEREDIGVDINNNNIEDTPRRSLKIWVADKDRSDNPIWTEEAGLDNDKINIEKLEILANSFLKEGLDNDIFDYVTSLIGSEWSFFPIPTNVIGFNGDIHILLFDIPENYLGYFYSRDNYKSSTHQFSNQKIMFTLNSTVFGERANKGTGTWSPKDSKPDSIISTLAHELQHMIHFHQKIKQGVVNIETWSNELCSMMIEDLLSEKLDTNGPRGLKGARHTSQISTGRLGFFNRYSNDKLVIPTSEEWNSGSDSEILSR
ncbi:MAG: hypothetical protein JXR63_09830, partial [Spirochaetales bacterium]|nr:hypothetical protein [Spirochaetales bacterium]